MARAIQQLDALQRLPPVERVADRLGSVAPTMEITLVIPAHNEEERLAHTLRLYGNALEGAFGPAFEIIVVANGCTDATADVARTCARFLPQVRLVDIQESVGKGGAILEGFRRACGRRLVFADADAATDAASLLELASGLDQHDVVIGSRRLPNSVIARRQPAFRRFCSRAFLYAVQRLFNLPYLDTQCGAKAFRPTAARLMAERVRETRWTFDLDILLTARELGLSIGQQPVYWTHQPGSRLRILPTTRDVSLSLLRLARRHGVMPLAS